MYPWDEIAYFARPNPTYILANINTEGLAVQADPMRVGLIFAASTGFIFVSPDTSLIHAGTVATQKGMPVNASTNPMSFIQKEWGPIVQAEWHFAMPTGGTMSSTLTVIELLARNWPIQKKQRGNDAWLSRILRSIYNTGRKPRNPFSVDEQTQDNIFRSARRSSNTIK